VLFIWISILEIPLFRHSIFTRLESWIDSCYLAGGKKSAPSLPIFSPPAVYSPTAAATISMLEVSSHPPTPSSPTKAQGISTGPTYFDVRSGSKQSVWVGSWTLNPARTSLVRLGRGVRPAGIPNFAKPTTIGPPLPQFGPIFLAHVRIMASISLILLIV
jgi:hypothetical protein